MTFADLVNKILNEATPDPRGLVSPSTFKAAVATRPDKDRGLQAGRDRPGLGGTGAQKMLRNAFRLLRNDDGFSSEVNGLLADYISKRKSISADAENTIRNNIANIDDKSADLDAYVTALDRHHSTEDKLANPDAIKKKIDKLKSEIEGKKAELKDVLDEIEFYAEDNEVLEQNLRKKLERIVKQAAEKLIDKLNTPHSEVEKVRSLGDIDQLVYTDENLEQDTTKLAVLMSLTDESPQNNILKKFLDLNLNKYEDYKRNLTAAGPLASIELNREFGRLPLSVFRSLYNASIKDSSVIKLLPMTAGAKALSTGFKGSQAGRKAVDPSLIQANKLLSSNFGSNEQGVAMRAKSLIKASAAGPKTATKLSQIVDDIISGVEGAPARFAAVIYGNDGPINESFNGLVEHYLTEAKKGARCTKVTGQQASSRSDKKYMRCARVDGKLKRIHYGDPNLRIKKSNPKKRKSFRARHKCSSAKPGTAKYYSCKNW